MKINYYFSRAGLLSIGIKKLLIMKNSRIHSMINFIFLFLIVSSMAIQAQVNAVYPVWNPNDPSGPVFTTQEKETQRVNGMAIYNMIVNASLTNQITITIPPGDYRFSADYGKYPVFNNLHDLKIIANNVTFWFDAPQIHGIEFNNCNNVQVIGLTLDYDPIPFCQTKITAINGNVARVAIMPGYTYQGPIGAGSQAGVFYKPDGTFIIQYFAVVSNVAILPNNQLDVTVDLTGKNVGDYLIIPIRTGQCIRVFDSSNMLFQDVNIWSSPGMGITEGRGGANVYRRIKITRRPNTNRLHCTGADGMHMVSTDKGALIEDCEIAYLGDDIINFHGFFSWVSRRDNARSFRVIATYDPFEVGQKIDFWDRETVSYFGNAKINTITKITNQAEIDAAKVGMPGFWKGDVYDITLDSDVNAQRNTLMENQNKVCSGFIVRGGWFHDIFNRAFLLNGSPNGTIENNVFQNIHGSIDFQMETWQYMEGQFIKGLKFQNNQLKKMGGIKVFMIPGYQGPFRTTPHSDITIQDNNIDLRDGVAEGIQVLGVDKLYLKNNIVKRNLDTNYILPTVWENQYGFSLGNAFFASVVKNAYIEGNQLIEQGANNGRDFSFGNLTENIYLESIPQFESIADFNTGWFIKGTQNDLGWSYGTLDGASIRTGAYNPNIFTLFNENSGGKWYNTGSTIPSLDKNGGHPTDNLATAKRWISTVSSVELLPLTGQKS